MSGLFPIYCPEPFYAINVLNKANEMAAAGEDVLHLELGAPRIDAPISQADINGVIAKPSLYTDAKGQASLRAKLAKRYDMNADNCVVGPGSSALLWAVVTALKQYRFVTPEPYYPAYKQLPKMIGATIEHPIYSSALNALDPNYDIDAIASCGGDDAVLIIGSPSNPLGQQLSHAGLQYLRQHYRWIIVDEIYKNVVEPAAYWAAQSAPSGNIISINSASKRWALPGIRIGWMWATQEVCNAVEAILQHGALSASDISQAIAELAAESPMSYEFNNQAMYQDNAQKIQAWCTNQGWQPQNDGLSNFYIVADTGGIDSEMLLSEKKVAVAPGKDFGPSLSDMIRLSTCISPKLIAKLETIGS